MLLILIANIHGLFLWTIKKGITITNAFQTFLDDSNPKPTKIWVDKGNKFYNRSMKSFLQNSGIEMYSKHTAGKSVIAEKFIRT